MAACVWRNAALGINKSCRINNIEAQWYLCRHLYTKPKPRGPHIKDKMHTMQLFLQDHPGFEYKIKPEGRHPGENITLKQLLEKLNAKDPELHRPINIGLPTADKVTRQIIRQRRTFIENLKSNDVLEKAARTRTLDVPLDEVKQDWLKTDGMQQIKTIAEHYGIYQDMFDGAFFYPQVPLRIQYAYNDEYATPVHNGNHVKPSEAFSAPSVFFESDPNSLWTLVLTNLDGHLQDSSMEYLHWLIGNIPGNDVSKGEVIMDYLQPFPAKGTGFHRFVFILYKQEQRMDYAELKRTSPCLSLKERTFETFDFYSNRQDHLVPAGLAFFQSDWDESVKSTFHHTLKMREPIFEYDYPAPVVRKQQVYPRNQPFNTYLDKYRDPRDIGQEILMKRLKKVNPFEAEAPKLKYPNTVKVPYRTPEWLQTENFKEAMRIGKFRGLDVEIFKPDRPQRAILGYREQPDGTLRPFR